MRCPNCGKEVWTASSACPFCGASMAAAPPKGQGGKEAGSGPVPPPAGPQGQAGGYPSSPGCPTGGTCPPPVEPPVKKKRQWLRWAAAAAAVVVVATAAGLAYGAYRERRSEEIHRELLETFRWTPEGGLFSADDGGQQSGGSTAPETGSTGQQSGGSSDSGGQSGSSGGSGSSSWSAPSAPALWVTCYKCHGDGKVDCSRCDGDGGKWVYDHSTPNYSGSTYPNTTARTWENCSKCHGTGETDCTNCGGTGRTH